MSLDKTKCTSCDGEGLVDFTDEEWIAMYGVPMSEYVFTGKEPETMKNCSECKGSGCPLPGEYVLGKLGPEGCFIIAKDGTIAARIDHDGTVRIAEKIVAKIRDNSSFVEDLEDCGPHSWKPGPKKNSF